MFPLRALQNWDFLQVSASWIERSLGKAERALVSISVPSGG